MAIHLLVVVAKMPFLQQWFLLSPLFWPFNLYLPVSRYVIRMCNTLSTASSLLTFRLRRIIAGGRNGEGRGLNRIERALRLFWQETIAGSTYYPHNAMVSRLYFPHAVAL
ncbi:hypothetical protein NE237_022720 [Protea cynaroides]|uniref:Uncharacterized protein n=1 Tax=Protea cynaroides TaxID=273540 RepID=A0A9Q0HA66_9MAGN|nr:hypothetical protein NE237_022720 [Protea cynaroides]